MSAKEHAQLFKLLSCPSRLCILKELSKNKQAHCVGSLAQCACTTPSNTSHQLKKLEKAGVVTSKRKGKEICYRLTNSPPAQTITRLLAEIT